MIIAKNERGLKDQIRLILDKWSNFSEEDNAARFNQYLGLSKEQAEESLTNAQRGQCFSRMSDEEARQIKEILNNAGVDI